MDRGVQRGFINPLKIARLFWIEGARLRVGFKGRGGASFKVEWVARLTARLLSDGTSAI